LRAGDAVADFNLDNDLRSDCGRDRDPGESPAWMRVGRDSADAEQPAACAGGGAYSRAHQVDLLTIMRFLLRMLRGS